MAATNPMRVSDLLHKYGWDFIPYAATLGRKLAEAQVLFVDSGHTNASDADDGEHGHSFDKPLATIDYAVGLCTASEGSVILVAPGHNEGLGASESVDFDIAGVTVIGIGNGSNRPTIDYDDATAVVSVGANDVHLINLRFRPSEPTVAIGVDVEASVTGTIIESCEFAEGEDGSNADEFVLGIDVKAGCTDTKIKNCLIRSQVSADGCTAGIKFTGASDNCIVKRCRIIGNFSTAGIHNDTAACTDLLIDDCTIKVKDGEPGIEVHANTTGIIRGTDIEATTTTVNSMIVAADMAWFGNRGVTTDGTASEIIGGGEVHAALNTAIATAPTAKSLLDILNKDGSLTYSKTTDSLEAISEAIAGISSPTDVTGAVPDTPTSNSLQDILSKADGSNTYDNTTDSLEAISDYLRGATIGDGINLDHLAKTDTGVVADADISGIVVAGSILGHIMSDDANPADYDASTDSLQAIADAVAGISDNVTTAVSQTPTARSLQDILEKDGAGNFDDSTDSLEAIADRLIDANVDKLTGAADGGTNAYPDSVAQESVIAYLMSKSANPVTTSYDNTTDSLEAIADSITAGTSFGVGINLDHLNYADTTVAADGDLTAYVGDGSILSHIMTKAADTDKFQASTDSLQAISEALAAGTGCTAAIDADGLDHLVTTADGGSNAYPDSVAQESIFAYIMSKSANPVTTSYNNTTDSLEAIADALAAGTGCTAAIDADGLDHLVTTADGGTNAYPDSVAQESIFAYIMSKSANPVTTSYNNTTDSLEAIADAVAAVSADSTYIADGSLPVDPTANSLAAFIASGGTALGTELADSHSIVDAIGHDGNAPLTDGVGHWVERTVKKTGADADADDLFTIANGGILIKSLIGVVTTVIGGTQTRIYVHVDSTSGNDDREFSTHVDITGDSVGTIYVFSTANPAVLTPLTTGATGGGNPQYPWYCPAGVIETGNDDDAETGAIDWYLTYIPLATGVTVVAA